MKKLILLVILAFSMVLSPLATTIAATPKVINYQGQLESDAITSQAPVLVVFELFEDAAGGSALWIEQKSVTVDKNGFFSVYLGDVNPIDLKFDKQYYVQVTVGNNQPFPRTKLSSTPSAFYAADADTALYSFESGMAMDVVPNVLEWDNFTAAAVTAGGVLTGTYPNPGINPNAILDNIPDGSITSEMLSPNISTSPSGPAGGDLSGVYPDPLIAVGAVKTDRIFDAAVTNEKIADGAVTNNKIVSLDAAKLTNVPALNYQVAVATDATIDGDGTLAMPLGLADNAVSTPKIVDGAVTNAKVGADAITTDKIMNETILAEDIATGAVTTDEILDETIIAADIATGAVTTDEILDETILATDIATGAVTTDEILDETILATDIATGAVTTSEILNGTILEEDIADDAVTNAKLAADAVRVEQIDVIGAGPVNGDVLYFDGGTNELRWGQEDVETSAPLTGNGTTADPVTLDPTFGSADELLIRTAPSGWVSSKINTANINDMAITTAKLADNSVTSAKIVDGEVMNADLANGSVTTAKILDGQVMTDDLMDLGVTTAKLADNSVTTGKILDGEVQTADLDDAAVTTAKLADNSVNGDKVIDGSLSSLDLNATGVTPGIYGDPSANPSEIDVAEFNVDAQGRITAAVERTYTVLAAGTIFNESPVSDITVDGTYDNLDLQIKPGVVGNTELAADAVTTDKILDGEVMTADLMNLGVTTAKIADMNVTTGKIADAGVTTIKIADGNVTSAKILDGDVQTADLADGSVTSAKIADLGIATIDYADNSVINTKIGSGAQIAGKVLKADGAGNTVWGDDLGLTLPYTGSYDGPGDAFTITHTGAAGSGSAAVFTSSTATNTDPTVEITKDVAAGAGSALTVSGIGVTGTNYIATIENTNGAEGRTLLLENNAPVLAAQIVDPNAIPNDGDEFVMPDPGGTDVNDATLVVRNENASSSNTKLAIKTYGSIQANSTVQGTNLVAYNGQVTLYNSTTGAVAALLPPTNPGDPLNVTPALDINGTSTVLGINNIWESFDGNLFPAGTGTDRDVPTALAVSNSIGSIAAEPFITFQADGGGLTNNRVFGVNSTLTSTITPGDNNPITLEINLANANTWTGTQTLSAAGNGLVVTTNADFQGNIANSTGDVTVNDNLDVNTNLNVDGTSTLVQTATIGGAALAAPAVVADNNSGVPTIIATNNGAGSSIDATGNVTINSGGLNVTGATDLNTGLNVDGASTLDATTIDGALTQNAGQVTLNGNVDATAGVDVTAGGLNVTGATDLNTGLNVDGASTLDATTIDGALTQNAGQVTLNGNVDANSGLDLVGNFTFDGETITNIDNTAEGLISGDNGLPTSGNVANAIATVAAEPFLTFGADGGSLTNNRVFAVTANLTSTDGGADDANLTLDLSNTGVAAAAYGNNTGTSYSTFTVDAKGRLTAAATQAIVVNDNAGAADIDITGASSDNLDLQIRTDAVGVNELATADYSGDLAAGNYALGNLDNTIIGGTTPAAGTFTNLVAQTDFTLGGVTVDDIATSADAPLANDDTDLVTEGAVFTALAAVDLQFAYDNGQTINTTSGDIQINGPANLDVTTNITNTGGNVTVGDDLTVTGATTAAAVTASGLVTANAGAAVNGANLTVAMDAAVTGNVTAANVTAATAVTATAGDITATAGNIAATAGSVTAGTTVNAGTDVNAGGNVNATGNVTGVNGTFTGNVSGVDGTFTGNALVGGTLGVTGVTTTTGAIVANGGITMGGNNANDIYTSADPTNPIVGTDAQLITALAVQNALQAHTLQTAYVNGNVVTTSAAEGNVQIAGTEELDIDVNTTLNGNLTHVGNNTLTGNLGVTGATTLTGAVTQAGGQVTFGGNVDANNGLDVAGGANIAGGVNVTSGGVAVAAGGVTVTAGGVTVSAGANNFGPGVSTFNGNVITNTVDIAGGAGSEIDNTVIGANVAAAGTFTALTASSLALTGDLDMSGNNINNVATISNAGGANVQLNDDVVVTGTTDLQGTVSNTTGDLDINDGVDIDFVNAGESVAINSNVSNSTLFTVGDNSGGAHSSVSISSNSTGSATTITSTGGPALSVSSTAGTALNAGSPVATNTAVNAFNSSAANATVTLSNNNATSSSYALSASNGHIKASADAATVATPASVTVGSNTVIRITTGGGAHGPINVDAGTQVGQIIIITNEDAGTLSLNILGGSYIVPGNTAVQLVWNSAAWVKVD